MSDASTIPYQPALDGIRALAVAAVFTLHLPTRLGRGGQIGVDVFFVLSGFLITTLLDKEWQRTGRLSFAAFYVRRVRRLAPALVLVALIVPVIWLTWPGIDDRAHTVWGAVAALFYVSSWLQAFGAHLGVMSHAWSLSVEEHFYLLWPLCFAAVARRSHRLLLPVAFALFAASTLEYYVGYALGWSHDRLYFAPDTRAKDILVGCCLALLLSRGWQPLKLRFANAAACASLAVLGVMVMTAYRPTRLYELGWPIVLGAAALLIWAVYAVPTAGAARVLAHPVLVWLGKRSYGIYLWHLPIVEINRAVEHEPRIEKLLIAAGTALLTVLAAAVSYRFVEVPIRRGVAAHAS